MKSNMSPATRPRVGARNARRMATRRHFTLEYVEIGNEDWFDKSGSYDARFTQFYDAIKAKYPQLKFISTIGNGSAGKATCPQPQAGHAGRALLPSPRTRFFKMAPSICDDYDRNGPEIFVGEWAAHETSFPPWDRLSSKRAPDAGLKAALGDAAFMAAMERNSDLVVMNVTLRCSSM